MSFKHNRHSAPPTENSHKKKNTSRGSIKDDTPKPSKKRVGSKLGPSATFSDSRTCRLGMKSEPSFVRETNPTQDVRRSVSNEADQPSPNPLDEPAKPFGFLAFVSKEDQEKLATDLSKQRESPSRIMTQTQLASMQLISTNQSHVRRTRSDTRSETNSRSESISISDDCDVDDDSSRLDMTTLTNYSSEEDDALTSDDGRGEAVGPMGFMAFASEKELASRALSSLENEKDSKRDWQRKRRKATDTKEKSVKVDESSNKLEYHESMWWEAQRRPTQRGAVRVRKPGMMTRMSHQRLAIVTSRGVLHIFKQKNNSPVPVFTASLQSCDVLETSHKTFTLYDRANHRELIHIQIAGMIEAQRWNRIFLIYTEFEAKAPNIERWKQPTCAVNPSCTIEEVNEAAEEMFRCDVMGLVGRNLTDFVVEGEISFDHPGFAQKVALCSSDRSVVISCNAYVGKVGRLGRGRVISSAADVARLVVSFDVYSVDSNRHRTEELKDCSEEFDMGWHHDSDSNTSVSLLEWNDSEMSLLKENDKLRVQVQELTKKAEELEANLRETKESAAAQKSGHSRGRSKRKSKDHGNAERKSSFGLPLSSDNAEIDIRKGERLGFGAYSTVWEVTVNGWTCAMKEVNLNQCTPKLVDRFDFELEVMQRIPPHRNICHYLGHVRRGHLLQVFLTKYSANLRWKLNECLQTGQFLNPEESVRIALDVTRGLLVLHSHNFVHRDLKSDNVLIMLSEEDEVVNAVISDYDASFSMDDVDRGRTMIGTPGYTAPEILKSGLLARELAKAESDDYSRIPRCSEKIDVFSLGMLFYEILELHRPYHDSSSPHSVANQILNGQVPHLSERVRSHATLKVLAGLYDRCTRMDPEERPSLSDIRKELLWNCDI